jgi:hypothetical protein
MSEVLDPHMEGMTPGVEVGNDGLKTPVPVLVHDIATVTVCEKRGVETAVVWPGLRVRSDAMRCAVMVGAGVWLIHVPTIAWRA